MNAGVYKPVSGWRLVAEQEAGKQGKRGEGQTSPKNHARAGSRETATARRMRRCRNTLAVVLDGIPLAEARLCPYRSVL